MKPSDLSEEQIQTLFELFDRGIKPKEAARKTGIEYKTVVYVRRRSYWLKKNWSGSIAAYKKDLAGRKGFPSRAKYFKYLIEKKFGSTAKYNKYLAEKAGFESSTEHQKHRIEKRGFKTVADYRKDLRRSKSINAIVTILHENAASAKEVSQEIKKRSGFSVKPSTIERKIRQFESVGPWVNLDEETKRYKLYEDHWFVRSMMQEIV